MSAGCERLGGCCLAGSIDCGLFGDAVLARVELGFSVGALSFRVCTGWPKASSASASVTRFCSASCLPSAGADWPNSNFAPRSCSRENSSRDGYLEESSSTAAGRTFRSLESSAVKGSVLVPRDPAGVPLADKWVCWLGAVGRPRRIGAMSGMTVVVCCTSATF